MVIYTEWFEDCETPSRAAVGVTCGRMRLLQTFKELLNYCEVEVLGVEVIRAKHTVGVHMQVKYPHHLCYQWLCGPKLLSKPALLLIATLHKSLRSPYLRLLSCVTEKSDREREPCGLFSIITT